MGIFLLSHDAYRHPTLIILRNTNHFNLRQLKIHIFFCATTPSGPKPPHLRGF